MRTINWRTPSYPKDRSYASIKVRGIYIIGYRVSQGVETIYVGQGGADPYFDGTIGERLDDHKDKDYIRKYDQHGTVVFTYANLSSWTEAEILGAEKYLHRKDVLNPLESSTMYKGPEVPATHPSAWY